MGTLPSSCFLNPNLRFRSFPLGGGFKGRNSVPERSRSGKLCFLCKRNVGEWKTGRRFDGIRCFSVNGSDGRGEEKRSGNQSTEEAESIAVDEDLNSEANKTSRVHVFSHHFLFQLSYFLLYSPNGYTMFPFFSPNGGLLGAFEISSLHKSSHPFPPSI